MFSDLTRSVHYSFVLLFCTALLCGCNDVPNTPTTDADKPGTKGKETPAEKCRRKLAGAIRRLEPQHLTMQADPERSISGLNSWIASCAAEETEALQLSEATLEMLDQNPRATAGRFSGGDAIYIRDALAMRTLNSELSARTDDSDASAEERDVNRVSQAFAWMVRNISLKSEHGSDPPLGLFDILMTGVGTAEDRAWGFAELLRQQQTDAVIVRTAAEPQEDGTVLDTATWLVAVIQNDHGWLFDTVTGLPVTADVKFNPAAPAPLPLKALNGHDRWKDSAVEVIAQVATFSPRMLVLQDSLAAEDSAILFEELTGDVSEIRPMMERILTAGGDLWKASDLSVWSYPEERSVSANSLSEEELREYKRMMRPFEAPFERDIFVPEAAEDQSPIPQQMSDEERAARAEQRLMELFVQVSQSSEKKFGKPSYRLLSSRTKQVLGSTETTIIQQMQQIRLTSMNEGIEVQIPQQIRQLYPNAPATRMFPLPSAMLFVNEVATGNSMYWTALSQIDRGDSGMAISTLRNYRKLFPDGDWQYPSMITEAVALVGKGRLKEAAEILRKADEEMNPERGRVQRLLRALPPAPVKESEKEPVKEPVKE